jgi:hypothetical protein
MKAYVEPTHDDISSVKRCPHVIGDLFELPARGHEDNDRLVIRSSQGNFKIGREQVAGPLECDDAIAKLRIGSIVLAQQENPVRVGRAIKQNRAGNNGKAHQRSDDD